MGNAIASTPLPKRPEVNREPLVAKKYIYLEVITQLAVRILFITGAMLIAAAAFSPPWQSAAICIAGGWSAFLAGFFYLPSNSHSSPRFFSLPPLIRPVDSNAAEFFPSVLPLDAPRGYRSSGTMNCAFNAMIHYLDSEPNIAEWVRAPLREDIDLEGFKRFLSGYRPPEQMMVDFENYVRERNGSGLSIPALFEAFLPSYVPPLHDLNTSKMIQETFRNLRLLQKPFSDFFHSSDEAFRSNQQIANGELQALRVALNQVTPSVDPSPNVQMDVNEAISPFFSILPNGLKIHIERLYHFSRKDMLEMAEPPQPKQETLSFFSVALQKQGKLEETFRNYCNNRRVESQNRFDIHGNHRPYKIQEETIDFLEPPPALRFHVMRFGRESVRDPIFNRILGDRTVKLDDPMECPDEMAIQLKDGRICRYRLASFVTHHGESPRHGHYTAGRILNGRKYLINNERVTLVDPERMDAWKERLSRSYLLCYLPV